MSSLLSIITGGYLAVAPLLAICTSGYLDKPAIADYIPSGVKGSTLGSLKGSTILQQNLGLDLEQDDGNLVAPDSTISLLEPQKTGKITLSESEQIIEKRRGTRLAQSESHITKV